MKKFYTSLMTAVLTFAMSASLSAVNPILTPSNGFKAPRGDSRQMINADNSVAQFEFNTNGATPAKAPARAGEEDTWTSLGMAQYTEDFMTTWFNVGNPTYEVEIQENDAVPGFYRLVNAYGAAYPKNETGDWDASKDYYIYIHAEDPAAVYIELCDTGLDWGYGNLIVYSYAGMYVDAGYTVPTQYAGKLEDGVITFPTQSLLARLDDYTAAGKFNYCNLNGAFRVVLPGGKDYSISVEADGCAADNKIPFTITTGADVAYVALCCPAEDLPINEATVSKIFADQQGYGLQILAAGSYTYTLSQTGKHTLLAFALDENYYYKGVAGINVWGYENPDDDNWKVLGTGAYTDDYLASFFTYANSETMEVEIQECRDKRGYYRVLNPLKEHSFAVSYNNHDTEHPHYLYIDASDPEHVVIEESPMGIFIGGNELVFTSDAYYMRSLGYSDDEIDSFGTYDKSNYEITFPAKALLTGINGTTGLFYANSNGKFKVVVPSTTAVDALDADNNAPAEYFDLNGRRVLNATPGIYIVRKGDKTMKVVVK